MKDNGHLLNEMINNIRVHGAVLILGAGASYESGMPLYAQFPALIWRVVDENPQIKRKMGIEDDQTTKDVIGNNIDRIKSAFDYIERDIEADKQFKELFLTVNDSHKSRTSTVHQNICKLVHEGFIKLIVSFNWDDLLENEWEKLYGTHINDNRTILIKPHGDVRNIVGKWVYPNSPGMISDAYMDRINEILLDSPKVFILLGYSGRDETIAKTLIKPNEKKSVLYRVSPSATGESGLPYSAGKVTTELIDTLIKKDDNTWVRVDFSNQSGLENAIMGRRLLPCDVTACPRLPMISDAKMHVDISNFVVIEGAPGSGKSITAYQLAWDYHNMGWEVLKLNSYKDYSTHNIEFTNTKYKTVYLIDDAQQIDREKIIELMAKSNANAKLIVTQTITQEFPGEKVTISQQRSVQTLYDFYKSKKEKILPIVKAVNKSSGRDVGTGFLDTPFEFVLDAAKKEKSIWLFNYSLRGGWQSVVNECYVAREANRADVLLTLIAIKQIFSLDKPVDIAWLQAALLKFGFDSSWLLKQLDYLYSKKLILSKEEVRTPHLQTAIRIIANMVKNSEKDELRLLQDILREECISERNPLLGTAWFFNMLFSFEIKFKLLQGFFTKEFVQELLHRCTSQVVPKEIAHAAYVVDRVIHVEASIKYANLLHDADWLIRWMNDVNNETAYALSDILNSMINESKEVHAAFVDELDVDAILTNIKKMEPNYMYGWAHFIGRLSYSRKSNAAKAILKKLPKEEIHSVISNCTTEHVGAINELLCRLRYIDKKFVFDTYHSVFLPIIRKAFEEDFCNTLRELSIDFLLYVLGEKLFSLGKPDKDEKLARIEFVKSISPEMIRKTVFEGEPRDWYTFGRFGDLIIKYDREKFVNAIKNEDYTVLDEKTKDLWEEQADELGVLVEMLYIANKRAAEKWLFSKRNMIVNIKAEIAQWSPKTTKAVLEAGGSFSLTESHRWRCAAVALSKLNNCDHALSKSIVLAQLPEIKEKLYNLAECEWDEFYLFVSSLIDTVSDVVDMLVSDADLLILEEKWLKEIRTERYKHQRNELLGLSRLVQLLKANSSDSRIVERMSAIELEICKALENLIDLK